MNPNINYKPILFSTAMVQAILRGNKTQTRRIIKIQENEKIEFDNYETRQCFIIVGKDYVKGLKCKYNIGDILWVRETFSEKENRLIYRADVCSKWDLPDGFIYKPSIHMPRAACRIYLKITNIRIERLQDISNNDAINEGVLPVTTYSKIVKKMATFLFSILWDKINGKGAWDMNPYVWVYEFERI